MAAEPRQECTLPCWRREEEGGGGEKCLDIILLQPELF